MMESGHASTFPFIKSDLFLVFHKDEQSIKRKWNHLYIV